MYLAEIMAYIKNFENNIIVIDGRGGSGKSSIAKQIEKVIPESLVINLDEYQLLPVDLFCQENIVKKFEIPFEKRRFDEKRLFNLMQNSTHSLFILEGCFCFTNLSFAQNAIKVWVDVDKEIAKDRLNTREKNSRPEIPEKLIELSTKKWQESEDRYIANIHPNEIADIIVENH